MAEKLGATVVMKAFCRWTMSSLGGHVVFWEVIGALPLYLYFLPTIKSQGELTVDWAISMALGTAAIWAIIGAGVWFLAVKPMRDRQGNR